jgi:probable F420-dependent oxidoreductase
MARLKVGFIPIEGGHFYREAIEEVVRGEDLGFDSVWMEEHHSVVDHYWPSPITVLAGFATRTSRMTLGTDIVVAAFHHPVRLAEDWAMLDVISGGRTVLGIAIGYKPDEFALYGVDLERRGARFEEQLAIVKGLWTQDSLSFQGAYYRVEGALEPKPVQRPRPPVLIGGAPGPKLFDHIAEYGDGWIPIGGAGVREALPLLRDALEKRGRDPRALHVVPMGIHPTREKLDYYASVGVTEAVLRLPSAPRDEVMPLLDAYAAFV